MFARAKLLRFFAAQPEYCFFVAPNKLQHRCGINVSI